MLTSEPHGLTSEQFVQWVVRRYFAKLHPGRLKRREESLEAAVSKILTLFEGVESED